MEKLLFGTKNMLISMNFLLVQCVVQPVDFQLELFKGPYTPLLNHMIIKVVKHPLDFFLDIFLIDNLIPSFLFV